MKIDDFLHDFEHLYENDIILNFTRSNSKDQDLMKASSQLLFAMLASLLTLKGSYAREIHHIDQACLTFSAETVGADIGELVSNEDQLVSSSVHELMRLYQVKTCVTDGHVTGLQFSLATKIFNYSGTEVLHMAPIGQMTGSCDTHVLKTELYSIEASLASSGRGITYRYHTGPDGIAETHGDVDEDESLVWKFEPSNPVIGLFGRQSEAGIEQLGFITLDTACQASSENLVPIKRTKRYSTLVIPAAKFEEVEAGESDGVAVFGLPVLTFLFIIFGIIAGMGLILTSLRTLRQRKTVSSPFIIALATAPAKVETRSSNKTNEAEPVVPETDIEKNTDARPGSSARPASSSSDSARSSCRSGKCSRSRKLSKGPRVGSESTKDRAHIPKPNMCKHQRLKAQAKARADRPSEVVKTTTEGSN